MAVLTGWRYCPRCSAELEHTDGRVECPRCGFVQYANPVPAVSALVVDDSRRLMLGRRAHEPDAGLWDALGGFLDEGEDALDGLRRELGEEAGVEIAVGDFVGAFSDRYGGGPDAPSVLNLVWEARITSGEPSPADDVSELHWFAPTALPAANELAFRWLAECLRGWAGASRNTKGPANRPFG